MHIHFIVFHSVNVIVQTLSFKQYQHSEHPENGQELARNLNTI